MSSRTLAVAFALLVAGTAAARADAPPPSAPPPPAVYCCAAPSVWTGFYIGAHAGAGWSDPAWTFPLADVNFNALAGDGFSDSAVGSIFGGHLGANYQIHHFLIGAEVSWAGNRVAYTLTGPFAATPLDTFTVSTNDLLTVTGRIGFVHGNFLLYGKAGYASSNVELRAAANTGPTTANVEQRLHGYVVGAGLEMRMVSSIVFGLEYNFINLPGERFTGVTAGAVPGAAFNADIDDVSTHTFVARLSVLFGPNACCSEGLLGKY